MARRAGFHMVTLAVLVGALCFCTLQADGRERLHIAVPRDGAHVTRVIAVKGTVSLEPGEALVILARHAEFGWWYQGQTEKSGEFEIEPVTIGSPGDPSGARFSIAAFIVTAEEAARMKKYRARYGVPASPEKMLTVYRL